MIMSNFTNQTYRLIAKYGLLIILASGCAAGATSPSPQAEPPIEPTAASNATTEDTSEGTFSQPTVDISQPTEETQPMIINFSDFQSKLSSETKRMLLTEQMQADDLVHILFRTSQTPSEEQLKEIEQVGCLIQSIAQDILTCEITVQNIPKLAILDYVLSLDVGGALSPEE